VNSTGPKAAHTAQQHRKRAPALWKLCAGVPGVLANWKRVPITVSCVTDRLQISPPPSISSQTKVHDGVHARRDSGKHPHRPIYLRTGVLLRLKPNSSPNQCFPQVNCTNNQLLSSGHGGRGQGGKIVVFPATSELLAQLHGSASIVELRESSNERERRMTWPERGWPRWGEFCGGGNQFGGNKKFASSGERSWLISGGWLADDPAELVTGLIYRRLRRWPVNRTRRAVVGGRRRNWRKR
jgi:hypothetical protein